MNTNRSGIFGYIKKGQRKRWFGAIYQLVFLLLFLSEMLISCRSPSNPIQTTPAGSQELVQIAVKVYLDQAGIYQLNASDLRSAGLQDALINPSELRLFYKGYPQPMWSTGEGEDRIFRFYAQASDQINRRENVYWLVYMPDGSIHPPTDLQVKQALVEKVPPNLSGNTYFANVHVEENKLYLPQADGPDHWFWSTLPAHQSRTFNIDLDSIISGPARLRLAVWGATDSPTTPDHHIRVILNDHAVIDESWDGKGVKVLSAGFSTDILREGSNEILVEAPGIAGVSADIVQIDWFEIGYTRLPKATGDRLDFIYDGNSLQLQGFSGPVDVFDVTDPVSPTLASAAWDVGRSFNGKIGDHYIAVGPSGGLHALRFEPLIANPDLRAKGMGADYIAVGPPDLLEALQPLLDWRASQGLKVLAVSIQAVYDQFYASLPDAAALQAFMKYASTHWQTPPKYLLLVGDSSYDPGGYINPPQANQLPTFLVNTMYGGETASDVAFVQINDDPYPDLAIGHIPARNPSQVKIIVDKTISYEREVIPKGRKTKVLAIADGQDPAFQADAQAFLDLFPPGRFQVKPLFPQAGDSQANVQIKDEIQQDFTLVAYFGHGSVNTWGKDRLFTSKDVKSLSSNNHLPVILNFTCLTGFFIHPNVESLAETFLWQPGGGAVAVLAPSSLTLPTDQDFLSNEFARLLVEHPDTSLGQLHLMARRSIPADLPGANDVLQTFLLFGDPALKLAIPAP